MSARVLSMQKTVRAFAFPWQGVLLILPLGLAAALRQHPEVLRPVLHSVQDVAALTLPHVW